jgi:hypothetical protein
MRRLLIALTAAGAALRFATLDVQSFWFDETVTVGLVRHDLWGMLDRIPGSESTPPLYYLAAWLWTRVFGEGEVAIRSLSAALGTASIPVFYLAARELTKSERVGVAVAALAAFNPLLVWYSQEARTYTLLVLLGGLSLHYFARLLDRVERGPLVGWALTSAVALTAHYFAGFLVIPEVLLLLRRTPRSRPLWAASAAVVATGLALLPLAIHQQRLDLASFIKETALVPRLLRSGKQFLVGFDAPLEIAATAAAGAVVAVGIVVALRGGGRGVYTATALAAFGLLAPVVLALLGLDYVDGRNLLVAWLPLFTVAAAGLSPNRAGLAGIALVCAIGLGAVVAVDVTPSWQRHDWRGISEALGPAQVNRAVVLTPAETGLTPFRHYEPSAEPMGTAGATVSEVALVTTPDRRDDAVHPPAPPRPPDPRLPGFDEARRVYAENFTVVVFRRRQPLPVTPSFLAAYRLLRDERPALLFQPASSPRSSAHLPSSRSAPRP